MLLGRTECVIVEMINYERIAVCREVDIKFKKK